MTTRQKIVQELESLSQRELEQVARYLAFVKSQSGIGFETQGDEKHLAALYAEFADEDRELAEQGLADYAAALTKEDGE